MKNRKLEIKTIRCQSDAGARMHVFTILNSLFFILLLGVSNAAVAGCLAAIPATTPTADIVDHGDGTVTHTKTGLMWKQCSEGLSGSDCLTGTATQHTWQAALQLAETLNAGAGFAGLSDWRLPNVKELNSIVERQCSAPAINATVFPNTLSARYWSSSSIVADPVRSWTVNFFDGSDNSGTRTLTPGSYVRLVRGE